MLRAIRIKLNPTPEQDVLFWKNAGTLRWAYNFYLSAKEHVYYDFLNNGMKQCIRDTEEAYRRYFKGMFGKPSFKSRRRSKISFYFNDESLKRMYGGFHGEKLGFVKTSQPLPKLRKGQKYSNPRISYDGKYWYLSIGYEANEDPKP